MSENLILVSGYKKIEAKYNTKCSQPNLPTKELSVISSGDSAWVMTENNQESFGQMMFGLTPEYSLEQLKLLNIRTDNPDNKEDDENEIDRLHMLFLKNNYNSLLMRNRCIVFVDAFLVTGFDSENYLIHLQKNERPFAVAAIFDRWLNFETNLYETGFAIITAAANPMLSKIGVEHMPVIIAPHNIPVWLDSKQDKRKIFTLIHSYSDIMMNGYPVSNKIFTHPEQENLQPVGDRFKPLLKV